MSPETSQSNAKICPTCGTRLPEEATRCLVCGTEVGSTISTEKASKAVQGTRMPEITLSLPVALILLTLVLALGAVLVFFTLRSTGQVVEPTPTVTLTITPTVTLTETPTSTATITPTITPLPPIEYTIQEGDSCISIALFFKVSVQSIVVLNNLPQSCNTLIPGNKLLIPQPTPTPLPPPTATLNPAQQTEAACDKIEYTVTESDTLSKIAAMYDVPIGVIKEYNGLVSDNVFLGDTLTIPLCKRNPTPGPTPTPTPPPPYPAPNLLLPADGAPFTLAADAITLQWASVGTLRPNERYAVTITDVTAGTGRVLVEYVTDTKFIVPVSFRPTDNLPHVMRWFVITVRQVGTNPAGEPIWEPAGAASTPRVFTWTGTTSAATPTP